MPLVFGCSDVACQPPARREKHTESAFNTAHSVSTFVADSACVEGDQPHTWRSDGEGDADLDADSDGEGEAACLSLVETVSTPRASVSEEASSAAAQQAANLVAMGAHLLNAAQSEQHLR